MKEVKHILFNLDCKNICRYVPERQIISVEMQYETQMTKPENY